MYTLQSLEQPLKNYAERYSQKHNKDQIKKMVQIIQKKAGNGKQKNEEQKIQNKTIDLNLNIPTITLNVNGLYTSIKKETLSKWILKNHAFTMCLPQETHFTYNDIGRLKVKGYATYK